MGQQGVRNDLRHFGFHRPVFRILHVFHSFSRFVWGLPEAAAPDLIWNAINVESLLFHFTYVFACIHHFEKSSKSFRNLLCCTNPDDKITCLDVISPLIDTCNKIRDCISSFSTLFLLVSILKSSTFLVVNAQRGFYSPPACDKYSVVDRHSLRVCLLLYANIAFSPHLSFPRLIWYINVFNVKEAKGVGSKPHRKGIRRRGLLKIGSDPLEFCVVMGCSCRCLPVGHWKHHLDYTDSLPCIIQGAIWNFTWTRGGGKVQLTYVWAEWRWEEALAKIISQHFTNMLRRVNGVRLLTSATVQSALLGIAVLSHQRNKGLLS